MQVFSVGILLEIVRGIAAPPRIFFYQ